MSNWQEVEHLPVNEVFFCTKAIDNKRDFEGAFFQNDHFKSKFIWLFQITLDSRKHLKDITTTL